jgi:hypothetical protein
MKVYTYSEARQSLTTLLEQAKKERCGSGVGTSRHSC